MRTLRATGLGFVLFAQVVSGQGAADLAREDHVVQGDPGIGLFVRHVHAARAERPAAFRAPSGALEDSDYLATGRQLVHAPVVRQVAIPDATHFVHRDRLERGRDRLMREILDFLGARVEPSR